MAGTDTEKKPVLEMVQADGADEGCVTFVLHEEDHTLGNSLRYMIMKNPEVEFCGYSITHPSESKINFRIQTRAYFVVDNISLRAMVRDNSLDLEAHCFLLNGGLPATEPLRKGLNDLTDVCKHVLHTFEAQVKDFRGHQGEAME